MLWQINSKTIPKTSLAQSLQKIRHQGKAKPFSQKLIVRMPTATVRRVIHTLINKNDPSRDKEDIHFLAGSGFARGCRH
jgi:hypothetical protein